jgi:hypothetical protein
MALPTSLRRRRGSARRVAAAATLAGLAGAVTALLAGGSRSAAVAAAPCLPVVCPTPAPTQSHTATPRPTATHSSTSTPRPTASHSNPPPPTQPPGGGGGNPPPAYVPPYGTPLPTLPPPTPGTPPEPPQLEVQKIQLDLASEPATGPGGQVLLQATLEAQRDTDTYSVPNAPVTFAITSQPGVGAFVDPDRTESGDTGVVVVTVQTSDTPGDTVVHAVSGNASADFTVHADPATPSPTAAPTRDTAPPVVAASGPNPRTPRPLLVASLAALIGAMVGGYLAALILGRLPNPLQRRVWGRRGAR